MGEGAFKCSLTLISQGSARFPNVGAGAVDVWALIFVYDLMKRPQHGSQ